MKRQIILGGTLFLLVAGAAFSQDAKDLYLSKCAVCHGPDGSAGSAMAKKLKIKPVTDLAAKDNAEVMTKIVTNGKEPNMDAFGKLFSKEQIASLVEYYRSLAK